MDMFHIKNFAVRELEEYEQKGIWEKARCIFTIKVIMILWDDLREVEFNGILMSNTD